MRISVYEDIQVNTVLARCYAVVAGDPKIKVNYKWVDIAEMEYSGTNA